MKDDWRVAFIESGVMSACSEAYEELRYSGVDNC